MSKIASGRGRKTCDISAQARYGNQDTIWSTIRKFKSNPFTFDLLMRAMESNGIDQLNDYTVRSYLLRLVKGHYLAVKHIKGKQKNWPDSNQYLLVNDCGNEAPRLRKDGSPSHQGLGNEQMWRTMKVLGIFNHDELAIAASTSQAQVKKHTAKSYCLALSRAGYLKVKVNGKGRSPSVYQLLPSKNTGPLPPQVQRTKRVFDPNLKCVVWSEDNDIDNG